MLNGELLFARHFVSSISECTHEKKRRARNEISKNGRKTRLQLAVTPMWMAKLCKHIIAAVCRWQWSQWQILNNKTALADLRARRQTQSASGMVVRMMSHSDAVRESDNERDLRDHPGDMESHCLFVSYSPWNLPAQLDDNKNLITNKIVCHSRAASGGLHRSPSHPHIAIKHAKRE